MITKKRIIAVLTTLALLAVPTLYILDRYDIPSKVRVKSRTYKKILSLTINPIKITDETFFEALQPSYLENRSDDVPLWDSYLKTVRSDQTRNFLVAPQGGRQRIQELQAEEPEVATVIVEVANRYSDGIFQPFGTAPQVLGKDFDWTDYPSMDDDIIYVWELNTLQHLPFLAQAYLLTRDGKYLAAIRKQIDSWIDENPIDNSANWIAAMEVSLRLCSLIWVEKMLILEDDFTETIPMLEKLIYAHAQHIGKYIDNPRRHNNHGIFAAMGLYFFAVNYPEFAESTGWKTFGEQRMLEELDLQYTENGVHKELAPTYHLALLDVYLHYLAVKKQLGESIPSDVLETIHKQLEYLETMTSPAGRVFLIGDSDDHHFIRYAETDYADTSPTLFLGGLLFGDARYANDTPEAHWKCRWLLGDKLYDKLQAEIGARQMVQDNKKIRELRLYTEEGYFRIDSGEISLLGDFTPTGMEKKFSGHNHSDLTSFLLWKEDQPITLDGGTYTYRRSHRTDGLVWRDFLRSSYAHNTAVIDGRSHALAVEGDFGYINYPSAEILFAGSSKGFNVVAGRHYAYKQEVGGAIRIFITYNSTVAVVDWFPEVREQHQLDRNFLLNAGNVDIDTGLAVFDSGSLSWLPEAGVTPQVYEGSISPPRGWYSDAYGSLHSTAQLQLRSTLGKSKGAVALFDLTGNKDGADGPIIRLDRQRFGNLHLYRMHTTTGDLIVLLQGDGSMDAETLPSADGAPATDAQIAVIEAGGPGRAYLFGGTYAEFAGRRFTSLPLLE